MLLAGGWCSCKALVFSATHFSLCQGSCCVHVSALLGCPLASVYKFHLLIKTNNRQLCAVLTWVSMHPAAGLPPP